MWHLASLPQPGPSAALLSLAAYYGEFYTYGRSFAESDAVDAAAVAAPGLELP